ncbi:MAG: DNA polymerase III subunit delta [Alphaproteobacteria bacterium]
MKIKPSDAERVLAAPPADCAAILLYGPDEGLVRDRSRRVAARVVGEPPDPIRLSSLDESDLKADPARLADEACGMALMPGDRLVRVRLANDSATKAVEGFLAGCADGSLKPDALVIVEGGDLPPRSNLRKLFEGARTGAAIACYADEAADLDQLIDTRAREAGLAVEAEARQALVSRLGADRGVTIQELDKLFLYKHNDPGSITREDVDACLPQDTDAMAGMLADQVAQGVIETLPKDLSNAFAGGMAPVAILRGVSGHFLKLHGWSAAVAAGADPGDVIKQARPPVHFKRVGGVRQQLRLWSVGDVETALQALLEAERQCKTTGMPDTIVTERVLLSLTRRAARKGRTQATRR